MLTLKIKDIVFKSPIMVASGTFGYGDEVKDLVDISTIGCIITKSVTLNPREGNPSPRIHETSSGMLNSIGLANVGVNEFCNKKLPYLNKMKTHFIINIAGSTMDEYIKVLNMLENSNGKHIGYEINISCPNVKEGGMEFGVDADMTYKLTSKLRSITNKLLIMKLSPNVTSIEEIALAAERGGADAVSAVNTFVGMGIDYKTGKMLLSTKFGGLSGPAIKPMAIAKIHKIYNEVKIPIIGMGGISNFEDIIEFIRAGSSLVQIGTLNYKEPSITCRLYDDLKIFLTKANIKNINYLVGKYNEK